MVRFSSAACLNTCLGISLIAATAPADAVSIMVPIQGVPTSFDVLISERSYASDPSLFSIASMPWWGDNNLASSFAEKVYNQLGLGSFPTNTTDNGPLFAYAINPAPLASGGGIAAVVADLNALGVVYELSGPDSLDPALTYRYAYVPSQSSTTAVPAPIPALGLAIAWRWSRHSRRRCRRSKGGWRVDQAKTRLGSEVAGNTWL